MVVNVTIATNNQSSSPLVSQMNGTDCFNMLLHYSVRIIHDTCLVATLENSLLKHSRNVNTACIKFTGKNWPKPVMVFIADLPH